jgi:hypothetical protein
MERLAKLEVATRESESRVTHVGAPAAQEHRFALQNEYNHTNSGHGGLHTCNLLFHGAIFRFQMSNPLAFYLEPTPVHLFLEKVSVTRA